MSRITQITCDRCKRPIDTNITLTYVDASVYGKDLHIECLHQMSADELIIMFDLDDIDIRSTKDGERVDRAKSLSFQYVKLAKNTYYGK